MTAKRHKLYLMISGGGAFVMSLVNVSVAVAFIVSFIWYGYAWKKEERPEFRGRVLWYLAGAAGIVIAITRTFLLNLK